MLRPLVFIQHQVLATTNSARICVFGPNCRAGRCCLNSSGRGTVIWHTQPMHSYRAPQSELDKGIGVDVVIWGALMLLLVAGHHLVRQPT